MKSTDRQTKRYSHDHFVHYYTGLNFKKLFIEYSGSRVLLRVDSLFSYILYFNVVSPNMADELAQVLDEFFIKKSFEDLISIMCFLCPYGKLNHTDVDVDLLLTNNKGVDI